MRLPAGTVTLMFTDIESSTRLLAALGERVAAGGAVALVSMCRGRSVAAADLDLTLRSTAGCGPLPEREELVDQLHSAGFPHVDVTQLMPTEPLLGLVAR